jgi:Beta-propeller repeat
LWLPREQTIAGSRSDCEGSSQLSLGENGELQAETDSGSFAFHAPEIYQYRGSQKVSVAGHYTLLAADEFSFQLGKFDHSLPLVIDPTLSYSTYLAGDSLDTAAGIAIDRFGSAYVTGYTASNHFPVNRPEHGTCIGCIFVTKLNPAGTALAYSTLIGGSISDSASGITVDAQGNASVAGTTLSPDFPQKHGLPVPGPGTSRGFVFSLNSRGSALNFSTFLAGDSVAAMASDSEGSVYVAGNTSSPLTPGGHQIGPVGSPNAPDIFLVKFSCGWRLAFSSAIGAPSSLGVASLAVDSRGEAVLTGTAFGGFPTTAGALLPMYSGTGVEFETYVVKLNSKGTAIRYGTYLGGSDILGGFWHFISKCSRIG